LTIASNDQYQAETSIRRVFSRTSNAPKRYGIWANSFLLKDNDIIREQEDRNALILKKKNLLYLIKLKLVKPSLSRMLPLREKCNHLRAIRLES
jgi:hypothetical protein